MSLNAILNAIIADGESQVRQIEAAAERQVEEILAQAQQEGQRIRQQAYNASLAPASQERARLLHKKRLEAMRLTGDVREELIETALGGVRNRLANLRLDPRYPEILMSLAEEALEQLDEPGLSQVALHVEADPRDRTYLEGGFAGRRVSFSYNLSSWGGVIARSEDGRVVVINTLEERLARATPQLRRYLGAFFEASHDEAVEPTLLTEMMT